MVRPPSCTTPATAGVPASVEPQPENVRRAGAANRSVPLLPNGNLRSGHNPNTAADSPAELGFSAGSAADGGAVRGVLDGPAQVHQLVPECVGPGEVLG